MHGNQCTTCMPLQPQAAARTSIASPGKPHASWKPPCHSNNKQCSPTLQQVAEGVVLLAPRPGGGHCVQLLDGVKLAVALRQWWVGQGGLAGEAM